MTLRRDQTGAASQPGAARMFLEMPFELERLAARPGHEWTPDECWRMQEWLNAPVPRARLLRDVLIQLARVWNDGPTADAEDLWSDFCLTRLPQGRAPV